MTAHTANLKAPFREAVENLRRDFPGETRGITFVNLAAPSAPGQVFRWIGEASAAFRKYHFGDDRFDPREFGLDILLRDQNGLGMVDTVQGRALVAASTRPPDIEIFPSPRKDMLACLYRETGRAILEGGLSPRDAALMPSIHWDPFTDPAEFSAEAALDAFAGAYGVHKGTLSMPDVARMGLHRALGAWIDGNVLNASTLAFDGLCVHFSEALLKTAPPAEIKSIAEDCGNAFRVKPGELKDLERDFHATLPAEHRDAPAQNTDSRPESAEFRAEWLQNLAGLCERADEKSLGFHLGARVLSKILRAGEVSFPRPRAFDVSDKKWNATRDMLTRRVKNSGFEKLINPWPVRAGR
jgi:hypothetical protein